MKIQCDVCSKESASVFCPSDEAALCDGCDHRVHHANKLAGKHTRFSILPQSSKESSPKCDICQDRRAFLFCQEDRAILCSQCDFTIHTTNEHTQKHNRFLLTGLKLSEASSSSQACINASPSSSHDQYFTAGGDQWQFDPPLYNGFYGYDKDVQFLGDHEDVNGGRDNHHYQNTFFH